jgi:hypothetical protein
MCDLFFCYLKSYFTRLSGPIPDLSGVGRTYLPRGWTSPANPGLTCLCSEFQVLLPIHPPCPIGNFQVTLLEVDLTYPEYPIKVLDPKDHVMRQKTIKFFKVQWSNHSEEEATWESKDFLHSFHPDFLPPQWGNAWLFVVPIRTTIPCKSRVEIFFKGGGMWHP